MSVDLDTHLAAIASGSPDAFAAWLTQAEEPLRQSLRSFARQVDVEAVLQEALLRVWQVAPRLEPDGRGNSLFRLAYRIARNLAVSETRKKRSTNVEPEVLQAGADATLRVEPRLPDPLLREAVERCREKLPKKPGAALKARLESEGGVPDATLAERLGMKKNTFLQNITRARQHLVDCLKRAKIDIWAELA